MLDPEILGDDEDTFGGRERDYVAAARRGKVLDVEAEPEAEYAAETLFVVAGGGTFVLFPVGHRIPGSLAHLERRPAVRDASGGWIPSEPSDKPAERRRARKRSASP